MKTKHLILPAITALIIASGCAKLTVVKNEPRQHAQFASQRAAETFYEAYLATHYSLPKRNTFVIYLASPYWRRTVSTDNIKFNAAVKSADANHDGIISDEEAQTYAAKVPHEGLDASANF